MLILNLKHIDEDWNYYSIPLQSNSCSNCLYETLHKSLLCSVLRWCYAYLILCHIVIQTYSMQFIISTKKIMYKMYNKCNIYVIYTYLYNLNNFWYINTSWPRALRCRSSMTTLLKKLWLVNSFWVKLISLVGNPTTSDRGQCAAAYQVASANMHIHFIWYNMLRQLHLICPINK